MKKIIAFLTSAALFMLLTAVPVKAQPQSISVVLTWTASVSMPSPMDVYSGYTVFRLAGACPAAVTDTSIWTTLAPKTPAAPALQVLTYTDTTATSGATYCYDVEAIVEGVYSAPSTPVQIVATSGNSSGPLSPPTNVHIINEQ